MSAEAESSSQALERYLSEKLSSLSLQVPDDDVEYMARFVEEEGLERDEKIEGVRGMLEGVVEEGSLPESGIDEALGHVVDEWSRLKEEEETKRAEAEEREKLAEPPDLKSILASMTPEEHAAAQRAALLREYGYVDDADALGGSGERDGNAPPKGESARAAHEKAAADERKALIEKALALDGKKKKYKKQQEVDLMAPNLNRDKVAYRAQMEREAAKNAAQQKRDRDKAALDKQRNDAAKAKADKQKKAAKQERRA
ncbi:hypothetical protein BD324DRAFT_625852 [Kockovaella imperatae]|uniref:Coiled-coil domain-containing protein 43 n=1 Tax=Kockovaella imperatae TaxID=4999 RepID=A0A1Y1UH33_9TREE|nr:hypothetical protein BD324DRAFT_625852 [Kockovaella imperatae]ORX37363.1 hypothetical protein BD324DRAFT_625852 [Kockovaella imperatae]